MRRLASGILLLTLAVLRPAAAPAAGWESTAELKLAAQRGDAAAQSYLGSLYYYGGELPRDLAQALAWWRKAAAQGEAAAQFRLGAAYEFGQGVAADPAVAASWYRLAAEQGDSAAQASLGDLYAEGKGVARDDAEALRWYRQSAAQFDASGQYALGGMYAAGRGVPADPVAANEWWGLAAESGFTAAQVEIGRSYEIGRGKPRDPVCAWFWYGLAEKLHWEFAGEQRAALEPSLNAAELAEARRLLARTVVPPQGPVQRPLCADETISLHLKDAALEEVLAVFEQLVGREILPPAQSPKPVTIDVEDVPWTRALGDLLASQSLAWVADGEVLRIVPLERR